VYNLTEDQKESLRWIVQKIRSGDLDDVFSCVFLTRGKFARFEGKGANITEEAPITESVLQALKASELIFIEPEGRTVLRCGLLGDKAYKAVDSNFEEVSDVRVTSLSEREIIWKIIISIILLGFALAGFIFLPWASAILWLFFLIIAYPVALAFTMAKQSMDNRNLVEIYKAGLRQIPVIGRFLGNKPSS
jgi:hypothetical protein